MDFQEISEKIKKGKFELEMIKKSNIIKIIVLYYIIFIK